MQQSREAGFAAHLIKPVNMQRLEEAIAAAVGGDPMRYSSGQQEGVATA